MSFLTDVNALDELLKPIHCLTYVSPVLIELPLITLCEHAHKVDLRLPDECRLLFSIKSVSRLILNV